MPQKTFFSRIRSYIIDKTDTDPEGRYFAICFSEILNENRKLLKTIYHSSTVSEIFTEYPFLRIKRKKGTMRRADIALINKKGNPVALIEVKCADNLSPGQLEDYIKYAKRHGTFLLFITRFPLNFHEVRLLKRSCVEYRMITFNELSKMLKSFVSTKSPLTAMMLSYLKENEMIYEQHISNGISMLLLRIFSGKKQRSRTLKATRSMLIDNVPDSFSAINSNNFFLAQAISERLVCGNKNPRPMINFWVQPYTSVVELEKLTKSANRKKADYVDKKPAVNCGFIWFEATITLSENINDWCALQFGVKATIDDDEDSKVNLCYYSWFAPDKQSKGYFESPSLKYYSRRRIWDMGDEKVAITKLIKLISKSQKKYLSFYEGKGKEYPKEWRHLKIIKSLSID